MEIIIQFIIVLIVVYIGYYVLVIRRHKKFNEKKCPLEALYLIKRYKIDPKKINFSGLLKTIALINAIIIALVMTIISFINGLLPQLGLAFLLLLILIMLSYNQLGKHYRKKGLTKDV